MKDRTYTKALALAVFAVMLLSIATDREMIQGKTETITNANCPKCQIVGGGEYSIGALYCHQGVQYHCRSDGSKAYWDVASTSCY